MVHPRCAWPALALKLHYARGIICIRLLISAISFISGNQPTHGAAMLLNRFLKGLLSGFKSTARTPNTTTSRASGTTSLASPEEIGRFAFDQSLDVSADIKGKYGFDGELVEIYASNKRQLIHKWHHYIPIYDRYFSSFRTKKIRFLEIGVSKGGSLNMWRKYLGDDAIIYGIDIDPGCYAFNGISGQVRIGSQDDPAFLQSVITEMGGVDIVLDDGSHRMDHILNSLKYLFPRLNLGGIYLIEDLHTAYWPSWGGGYLAPSNFFGFVSELIDDMHHWYHWQGSTHPEISEFCTAVHIHDSIAVLEKNRVYRPTHSQIV